MFVFRKNRFWYREDIMRRLVFLGIVLAALVLLGQSTASAAPTSPLPFVSRANFQTDGNVPAGSRMIVADIYYDQSKAYIWWDPAANATINLGWNPFGENAMRRRVAWILPGDYWLLKNSACYVASVMQYDGYDTVIGWPGGPENPVDKSQCSN